MFMRISSAVLLALALAACGGDDKAATKIALEEVEAQANRAAAEDGRIACAVSGATEFALVCQLEQAQGEGGLILTVRHPDGGFRRLQVVTDGRGVIAADGADRAVVKISGPKEIEVALAGDRYRLPASAQGVVPKS